MGKAFQTEGRARTKAQTMRGPLHLGCRESSRLFHGGESRDRSRHPSEEHGCGGVLFLGWSVLPFLPAITGWGRETSPGKASPENSELGLTEPAVCVPEPARSEAWLIDSLASEAAPSPGSPSPDSGPAQAPPNPPVS